MSNTGRVICGFCGGYLGDELDVDWGPKRIEAEGHDWIVVRGDKGTPAFASFGSDEEKRALIEEWARECQEVSRDWY